MYPADTKFVDWLRWFSADEKAGNFNVHGCFLLPDGTFCASTGRIAVASTERPSVLADEVRFGLREHLARLMTSAPAIKSVSMPFSEAAALFGKCEHTRTGKCGYCGGTMTVRHNCDCELCEADTEPCENCEDGTNTTEPDTRGRSLWGFPFNANLIAYVFAHAPAVDGDIRLDLIGKDDHTKILRLVTAQWTAIVVGLVTSEYFRTECKILIAEQQEVSSNLSPATTGHG